VEDRRGEINRLRIVEGILSGEGLQIPGRPCLWSPPNLPTGRVRWVGEEKRLERLKIFLKPIYTEFDGTPAMGWIGQTMICSTDDMDLFGDVQIVEDSQGLIQGNKFIFLSMYGQAI
jgi:hypothetical protein